MTATSASVRASDSAGFRHEALLYAGEDDFVSGTSAFVQDGLRGGESVMVAARSGRLDALRRRLGDDGRRVRFVDMTGIGRNPARIIPAWRDFLDVHTAQGVRVRGVGEPIWAERSAAELVECQKHEALINLAFAGGPSWRLLCPYDTAELPGDVIEEACRSHPVLTTGRSERDSLDYRGVGIAYSVFDQPLPEPPASPQPIDFAATDLAALRRLVLDRAASAGLGRVRAEELVLAVHEIASNSVRHGGGRGTLRLWNEPEAVVCEVSDRGRIIDPLVGRAQPAVDQLSGRGVWIANQLCDLVQVRSDRAGTVVRVHVRRG